jgi:HEAT repeat protein
MEPSLIDQLASDEGAARRRARVALGAQGAAAVPALIRALRESRNAHVRWGAVKALGQIGDARAIPALVAALEDGDPDVAWLAAEALRRFERAAWPALLRSLIRNGSRSVALRHGARLVFRDRCAEGCDELLDALMSALSSFTLPETTAIAAYDVLHRLEETT